MDPQSGEVSVNDTIFMLEPKAMDMLIVLSAQPRSIISTDVLFEKVWPRSVYSPNSIRRNIALIRKVLQDDDKLLIKTHPKRGYSLQAEIRFQTEQAQSEVQPHTEQNKIPNTFKRIPTWLLAISLIIVCVMSYVWLKPADTVVVATVKNLTPVTASGERERYMRISPNGRYMAIVQSDKSSPQQRHIMIKDLADGKVWQLSEQARFYKYLAWHHDGQSIVYSIPSKQGVEFGQLALNKKYQLNALRTVFKREDISWNSPFFIDKQNRMFYLGNYKASEHSRNVSLYQHDLTSNQVVTLLEPNSDFKPYKLALSAEQNALALVGFDRSATSVVKVLDLKSKQLSHIGVLDKNWYFMTWAQDAQSLMFSNGRALSQLHLTGERNDIAFNSNHFLQYIQSAGSKLYFVETRVDKDIHIGQIAAPMHKETVVDSNTLDWGAMLSPDDSKLAFISLRQGYPQLFVKDLSTGVEQVVYNNEEKAISLHPPIWHQDNHRVLSAANNQPVIIDTRTHKRRALDTPIGVPLSWYQGEDAILYVDKSEQGDWLYKYNLVAGTKTRLGFQLEGRQVVLSHTNQVLFVTGSSIIEGKSQAPLLKVQGDALTAFKYKDGFIYRYKQGDEFTLGYFGNSALAQPVADALNQLCTQACQHIESMSEKHILFSEQQNQADILSLEVDSLL